MTQNPDTPAAPSIEDIARAAAAVLRRNDAGSMTRAAPGLYPHMWSWDSAFIAIGLARFDVPRAIRELQSLLDAQWSTGMIPHIVFNPDEPGYFPDFDRWGTARAAARPEGVQTSGICQPPVHAIALRHILDRGRERGGADRAAAEEFARGSLDAWAAWHHWLASVRDPDGSGLVEIHHSWESGFDNSPRWDAAFARIRPGDVPPFQRRDTLHVADASERPTDEEYTRYLWLVEQLKSVDYDDAAAREVVDFRVKDVFFSAVLAVASDVLADLADEFGRTDLAPGLRDIGARFRLGVRSTIDPETQLARDFDVRAGEWIGTETIAGFAPLFAGASAEVTAAQTALLRGERWMGDPRLRFPLPPSTSPASPAFRPSTYWRGPTWPFLTLLLGWAVDRGGDPDLAADLRTASLAQLADLAFGEYYQPFTGEPLGSHDQSWTAAAALEWAGELGVAAG
ncbi:glucosylglycerate hydrolase [Leifsonia shinshuensis]|uniref:Glycogen debranching protein n=1 Tax=Leifsonia shinshuensis TaxID=150026 RepID=A0A7G6YE01_9MICO|nr:glycogen debranching protein [Leifsonia shinshuensis]QNE36716.1 glycogen debranching protein [Leifsonia shinshuensis]